MPRAAGRRKRNGSTSSRFRGSDWIVRSLSILCHWDARQMCVSTVVGLSCAKSIRGLFCNANLGFFFSYMVYTENIVFYGCEYAIHDNLVGEWVQSTFGILRDWIWRASFSLAVK